MVFLLEHSLWQATGVSSLSDCSSWCFGEMPDCGWWRQSDAISQTHFQAFFISSTPNCPCFSHGSVLPNYSPITDFFFSRCSSIFIHWSRLPIVLLGSVVVSLAIGKIDRVKVSGLKTSEGSEALQWHTETCLGVICLLCNTGQSFVTKDIF